MKIYFAGSIRGGREDKERYAKIISLLAEYGTVLTEHIGDGTVTKMGSKGTVRDIYLQDIGWLTEADLVVAEVTTPSLGVGYEIAKAEGLNKKIFCLYRPSPERSLSAMLAGNKNLSVFEYNIWEELQEILRVQLGKPS